MVADHILADISGNSKTLDKKQNVCYIIIMV